MHRWKLRVIVQSFACAVFLFTERRIRIRLISCNGSKTSLKHRSDCWKNFRIYDTCLAFGGEGFDEVVKVELLFHIYTCHIQTKEDSEAYQPHGRGVPPSFDLVLHYDYTKCFACEFLYIDCSIYDE